MKEISPDILGRFLSGEQTAEDEAAVDSWARQSEANADELFGMESIADEVGSANMSSGRIDDAEKRLFERINAAEHPRHRHISWLRYAACFVGFIFIAAAVCVGVKAWQRHSEAMQMVQVQAPSGRSISLSLSDGTRVWLRKGSSLSYPRDFEGKEKRVVAIDGEGFFKVAKNPRQPFVVKSNDLTVTVLGTVFDMSSSRAGSEAKVSLVEGIVRAEANNNGGSIVLHPGQKASIDRSTGFLQVTEVDAYAESLWHEQKTPFQNASINDIASQLGKEFGIKVVVHKGFDMSRRYNGVIDGSGNVSSVLALLKNALPIKYKVSGKTVHLYPDY